MGPLSQLMDMVPGMSRFSGELAADVTDGQTRRVEAIISSMTRQERRHPQIINASRKRRIARGSGTNVQDVNQLLGQFRQMQRLMKQLGASGKRGRRRMPGLPSLLGGLGG